METKPKVKRFLADLRKAGLFRYLKTMSCKIPAPDKNYRKGKWARKHTGKAA